MYLFLDFRYLTLFANYRFPFKDKQLLKAQLQWFQLCMHMFCLSQVWLIDNSRYTPVRIRRAFGRGSSEKTKKKGARRKRHSKRANLCSIVTCSIESFRPPLVAHHLRMASNSVVTVFVIGKQELPCKVQLTGDCADFVQ